jgi:hypothetical protein
MAAQPLTEQQNANKIINRNVWFVELSAQRNRKCISLYRYLRNGSLVILIHFTIASKAFV